MLTLAKYQTSHITLVGDAIKKLQADPAFIKFKNSGNNSEVVEFGGVRGSFAHIPLGPLDDENIKTMQAASNELTWMVRHATVEKTNGGYLLTDKFDLVPGGRS